MRPAPRRSAFTLIELLIVSAVVAVLLALTLPAIQNMRAAASRSACSNNLRQIGLALYGYHSTNGVLPQAYSNRGATEQARRSWATLVLPFLEQENLQNK